MAAILVTGAAGFIGSHTCDRLLAGGHAVVGVDDLRTGRRENLTDALRNARFRLVEADVSAPDTLERLAATTRFDAIIHLAALVSVPESLRDPALNFRLNIAATHLVAETSRRHGIPRVVFASSAAVYGDVEQLPITENSPKHPISPYGAAKLASESILLGHATAFGFTARCQRYFNVFGPRQDPRSPYSGVISIFCDRLRAGEVPTIFGDGEQTRDFISVFDVARANAVAALKPDLQSGAVNICTGQATSLNQLARVLRKLISGAPAPVYAPARPSDIRHSLGDAKQAGAELGFSVQVSLEQGLAAILG